MRIPTKKLLTRGKSLLLQPFSGRIGSCNWDKVALAVGIPASESDYYQHKPNFRNTFVQE